LVVFSSDADEEREDEVVVWWVGLWCGMDEDGGGAAL
jgi:hypothetical protein